MFLNLTKVIIKWRMKGESEMPVKLNEERKDNTTKISGVVQRDNGLCFANMLEDFIDCYNNYYKDKGKSMYSRILSGIRRDFTVIILQVTYIIGME